MTGGLVVAIDGPAGSGKSTIARAAAERLLLPHIDTGAIYRALTFEALRHQVPIEDEKALAELADRTRIELRDSRVLVNGEDVTAEIRRTRVTMAVSRVSSHPEVRRRMVRLQRSLIGERGAVMEGRDIGTVVVPDADLKIFLTADLRERARRRAAELAEDGVGDPSGVLEQILERDRFDSERAASPLAIAEGAVVIDSTGREVDDIVDEISRLAGRRQ